MDACEKSSLGAVDIYFDEEVCGQIDVKLLRREKRSVLSFGYPMEYTLDDHFRSYLLEAAAKDMMFVIDFGGRNFGKNGSVGVKASEVVGLLRNVA